jgi:hypothetical protein
MPKIVFSANQFTATQFSTPENKASFANHFFRFIDSGWKRTVFTEKFYNRLSNCFSHIAHCDVHGFYETWFTDDSSRLNFLRHTLKFPCYGDPAYTYSDVERAIQLELRGRCLVAWYETRVEAATRAHELAQLTRLQAKYGDPMPAEAGFTPSFSRSEETAVPAYAAHALPITRPVQISLF